MHRLSTLVKGSSSSRITTVNEKTIDDDNESQASTFIRNEPLPVPSLKVKRVDNYYSRWSKTWKYRVSCWADFIMYSAQLISDICTIEHELQEHSRDHPDYAK